MRRIIHKQRHDGEEVGVGCTDGRRRTTEGWSQRIQAVGSGGVVEVKGGWRGGEMDPKLGNRESVGLSRRQTERRGGRVSEMGGNEGWKYERPGGGPRA